MIGGAFPKAFQETFWESYILWQCLDNDMVRENIAYARNYS